MLSATKSIHDEIECVNDSTPELPPYLVLRSGVYYFKRKIPARTVRLLQSGKTQVWKSLETRDLDVALRKRDIELRAFEAEVNERAFTLGASKRRVVNFQPRGEGTTKYLLSEHIPFLLKRYEYVYFKSGDDDRMGASAEDFKEDKAYEAECLAHQKHQYATMNDACMEETADWLLSKERLIAPPGSKVRKQLLRQLLSCDIKIMEEQIHRMNGEGSDTAEEMPLGPRELPTLLDYVSEWSAKKKVIRTIDSYRGFATEFEAVCGALPVAAITAKHAEKFRDHLAKDKLTRQTVKNYIGGLATLLRSGTSSQAKKTAKTDLNVFDFVDFDTVPERPRHELRRAYEVPELNVLFQSRLYTQGYTTEGQAAESSYWTPLLGPFLGARIEEVAQLRMVDIQCINGQWALRIANLDSDQKLKTDGSYRMVPMHSELISCGFLAYVAKQKRAGHERVFPSQKNDNKHRNWSNALGKWHSAYLDSIGLTDPRLCYHSNRFAFKQRLSVCGVDAEVRDALSGHWLTKERQSASRGYLRGADGQYPFPPLVAAMKQLRYDELDLSHLYVKEPLKGVEILVQL